MRLVLRKLYYYILRQIFLPLKFTTQFWKGFGEICGCETLNTNENQAIFLLLEKDLGTQRQTFLSRSSSLSYKQRQLLILLSKAKSVSEGVAEVTSFCGFVWLQQGASALMWQNARCPNVRIRIAWHKKCLDFLDAGSIICGDSILPQRVLAKFQGMLSVLSRWILP